MSYDLRIGVRVEGLGKIVQIAEPYYANPTYNIGTMFRKCMDWDFTQGEWYKCSEVLPNIERGIHELTFNSGEYKKYNAPNGWGSTASALESLASLINCIKETVDDIPLEYLWVSW